jgi:hypothetical protein
VLKAALLCRQRVVPATLLCLGDMQGPYSDQPVPTAVFIDGSAGVSAGSPLAVASVPGNDSQGDFLDIFLYYTDANGALFRVAGHLRGASIEWFASLPVSAPPVDPQSLMTATTDGQVVYIYYLHDNQKVCGNPHTETISGTWFQQAKK